MLGWLAVLIPSAIALYALIHYKRRDQVNADRQVLDQIVADLTAFDRGLVAVLAAKTAGPPVGKPAADLRDSWHHLEDAATAVGRVSNLRYDGLRTLGSRIADACRSTEADRAILEMLAARSAAARWDRLDSLFPWPSLRTDSLIYQTLAVVYRREGPLTPRRRAWWRIPSRRTSTLLQTSAPIRYRVTRRKGGSGGTAVANLDEARTFIKDDPSLQDLSRDQLHELAYKVLYYDDPPEGFEHPETNSEMPRSS